ncbi:MAG: hypothetical protein H0T42_19020 [Deltaproteobacteria bacterium]|nr:hypothetical protein [Deltaproteobacteria bacterium]
MACALHALKTRGQTDDHEQQDGERDGGDAAKPPNREGSVKEDIWNTICPVCGSQVPPNMSLIELAFVSDGHQHHHQERPGIRLCSKECAIFAEKEPEIYRAAAAANRVAGDGKRGPEIH